MKKIINIFVSLIGCFIYCLSLFVLFSFWVNIAKSSVIYCKDIFLSEIKNKDISEITLGFHYFSPIEILSSTTFEFFVIQICAIYAWFFYAIYLKIDFINGVDKDIIMNKYRRFCKFTLMTSFMALIFLSRKGSADGDLLDLILLSPTLSVIAALGFYKKNQSVSTLFFNRKSNSSTEGDDRIETSSVASRFKNSISFEGFGEYGFYASAFRFITFSQMLCYILYPIFKSEKLLHVIFISTAFVSIFGFFLITKKIEKIKLLNGSKALTVTLFSICSLIYVVYISGVLNEIYSISSEYFPNSIIMMAFFGFSMIFNHLISIEVFSFVLICALVAYMLKTTKINKLFNGFSEISTQELDKIIMHLCVIFFVIMTFFNSETFTRKVTNLAIFSSYLTDFETEHPCKNISLLGTQKLIELKDGYFYIYDQEKGISIIKECKRKEVIEINKG